MDFISNSDLSSFILDGCPMSANKDEVFYIEAEYNEEVNALIRENLASIQDHLWNCGHKTFFYLPSITTEQMEQCVRYHAPGAKLADMDMASLSTSSLLDYLHDPQRRTYIKPGFARVNESSLLFDGYGQDRVEFTLFPFDAEKCKANPREYIRELCTRICDDTIVCHLNNMCWKLDDYQICETNYEIDQEGLELAQQIKEIAQRLYAKGVGECYIRQLIGSRPPLSRLVITKDYRIVLPDFEGKEIVMEPMNKAVYLLFLRHPEGIAFKNMIDYRQELLKIYLRLWTNKDYATIDWSRIDKAIDNICSPLSNSINEKTSRIKGIFLKEMHEDVAMNYCISGRHGEPRRITLPQAMIEWQTPDNFNSIEKYHVPEPVNDNTSSDNLPF